MAYIKYEIQAKQLNSVYHGFEQTLGDSGGQRSLAGYSPMGSQRVRYNLATGQQQIHLDSLVWEENRHQKKLLEQQLTLWQKLVEDVDGTPLQYSCLENPMDGGAWEAAVHGVEKSRTRLSDFTFTFHFHALEKEMATHTIVLAWRIPGDGGADGLPSMGSHRVGHDWSNLAAAAAAAAAVEDVKYNEEFNSSFDAWLQIAFKPHSVPSPYAPHLGKPKGKPV